MLSIELVFGKGESIHVSQTLISSTSRPQIIDISIKRVYDSVYETGIFPEYTLGPPFTNMV